MFFDDDMHACRVSIYLSGNVSKTCGVAPTLPGAAVLPAAPLLPEPYKGLLLLWCLMKLPLLLFARFAAHCPAVCVAWLLHESAVRRIKLGLRDHEKAGSTVGEAVTL